MTEIPENTYKDNREKELVKSIVKELKKDGYSVTYCHNNNIPLTMAKRVCKQFVDKGYHAKIVYFCDNRIPYQSFAIANYELMESSALMTYSTVIG